MSHHRGCFSTIQAAVDAAHDGDTIRIDRGTFAGDVTVNVSVNIVGAGAGSAGKDDRSSARRGDDDEGDGDGGTIIKGGGPVITIGKEFADTEPTVSISGVTITGGFNSSVPDHAVTFGGGVNIPQAGSFPFRTGATVTISDSVITGNTVASQQLIPPGFCGPFACSFASGGGIFNEGSLTLIRTRVTDNQAGAPGALTTSAAGGGIANSGRGNLTLQHCVVTGNRALGTPPYGVEAHGGGIFTDGAMTIEDSVVNGNSAELATSLPAGQDHVGLGGGIHIGDNGSATIDRTIVSGNRATSSSANGLAVAVAAGIDVDGALLLSQSIVDHNVAVSTAAASGQTAIAGGGFDIDGVATIRDTLIAANSATANAPAGDAFVGGGGVGNFATASLERTQVIGNRATANGLGGAAQGGGIYNSNEGGGRPPAVLTLTDSFVLRNTLAASSGIPLQGGGLFTTFPVALVRTVIAGNRPDQCFGCTPTPTT